MSFNLFYFQVLANIFKNLDTLDLVRLSRVNKLWFREARRLLKSRRVYARPRYSYPCFDLKIIDKVLKKIKSDEILYNGLYLQFDTLHFQESFEGCEKKYYKLGRAVAKKIPYTNILSKLKLKYLKINWRNPGHLKECPAGLIVPEILIHHGETLEELEIQEGPWFWGWLFDKDVLGSGRLWMPKLRVLKAKPLEYRVFDPKAILPLIQVAPNLEDLLVCVSSKEIRMGLIPKDRYKIIKSVCFERRRAQDLAAYAEFANTCPKLRSLILQNYDRQKNILYLDDSDDDDGSSGDSDDDVEDEVEEPGWEIFQKLLESSLESLEMIRIPVCYLASQMNSDSHVFPNVMLLALEIPWEATVEESYIHDILFNFDFKAKFPNLTSVRFENAWQTLTIYATCSDPIDDVHVEESQLSIVPADPCTTVTSLTLNNHVTNFSLEYCTALFPNLTHLDVGSTKKNVRVPYAKIWTEFPNVEMLSVREPSWAQEQAEDLNYDADFLGIFEDEAKDLRMKDLKNVQNMHIVPIKPSILTAKSKRLASVMYKLHALRFLMVV